MEVEVATLIFEYKVVMTTIDIVLGAVATDVLILVVMLMAATHKANRRAAAHCN